MKPSVAVASVTYNRVELMVRLLEQLRGLDYPAERLGIHVVDNASQDGTADRIERDFPEVGLVRSDENLGVSAGFNRAIREALESGRGYDYVWLLDSDAEVEPGTLEPLVSVLESDPGIGVVGSAVYDPTERERLVTLGLDVDWRRAAVSFRRPAGAGADRLLDVSLIPACSSLTRSGLLRELGPWDERFWLYWGDTDWCARVLERGLRVCCQPRSRVWHRDWANVRKDFGAPMVLHDDLRGSLLFNLRHRPGGSLAGLRRLVLGSALKAALESLTARPGFARAREEAVEDFLAGRFEKRPPSHWTAGLDLKPLDAACADLARRLGPRPRLLLNRIDDADRLRDELRVHLPEARVEEIAAPGGRREELAADVQRPLSFDVPLLLRHGLGLARRHDVIVSDVATPSLYNLVAARHTLLVDPAGRCWLHENRRLAGLGRALRTLLRGFLRAFLELPRAVRNSPRLREAVSATANG